MSLSRPFDFINDLNDSKYLWKIAVRITQIWYVQIPPKPGHLEMILMDSKEGEDDPKAFPLVLDELLARTMVLRVKVQPSYNQSSVVRLSEDPNLIKKVLDQIGVFEVFFDLHHFYDLINN
ncbi:hypothetical protein Lal_00026906 [Lupinus albus]|nr:hypothetical protein Lal_00026906 [Lupinus albus]